MILYTMMPHELIFPQEESIYATYHTIPCEDGHLIVEQTNTSEYKVVRLISGNPMNYLNQKYTPGTVIQAKPQL
ncbi:YlzJ-like family protein [Bacillus solitudinis]|uniref:YlzJ-like family protein n=1 Tax=Bacillus solitudinis TaxID=2014074 RepID=UPI000C23521A|nr:YlzJ-like family protein [Bacillus solitudinis]